MPAAPDRLGRATLLGRIGSEPGPRPGRGRPDARADRPGGRRPSALGAAFVLAGLAMIPWVL